MGNDNASMCVSVPGCETLTSHVQLLQWQPLNELFQMQKNLLLLCLDRKTGHVLWRQKIASDGAEKGGNNSASPSPVTDGQRVYIMFATGALATFDFSGKQLWHRDLAKDYGRFEVRTAGNLHRIRAQ
jgi:outer membrane protein assembly factor BamB